MDNYAQTTLITSLTEDQLKEISSGIYNSKNIKKVSVNNNGDSIPFESSTPQDFYYPIKQGAVIEHYNFEDRREELEAAIQPVKTALEELAVKLKNYHELKNCKAVVDDNDETKVLMSNTQVDNQVHSLTAVLQKTLECCIVDSGLSDLFKKEGL